jgi:hypothetical protein
MSDEQEQEAARAAAAGDPEAEAEVAKLRCRKGEHEWSEWAVVAAMVEGGPEVIQVRMCGWCFTQDHRRQKIELAAPALPAALGPVTQLELTPAGRRMQETRRNSHLRARWGPCTHEGCVRFENHGGDCSPDVPMPGDPPAPRQYEPTRYANTAGLYGENDPALCAAAVADRPFARQCMHAPWNGTEWCYNHQPTQPATGADLRVRIPVEELGPLTRAPFARTQEEQERERLVRWATANRPDLLGLIDTATIAFDPADVHHVVIQF